MLFSYIQAIYLSMKLILPPFAITCNDYNIMHGLLVVGMIIINTTKLILIFVGVVLRLN